MINLNEFDWTRFELNAGGTRLVPNKRVKGQTNKIKCFSREPYAQELFNILTSDKQKFVKKDLTKGDCVVVTGINCFSDGTAMVELSGGLSVDVDLGREKRFMQLFGYERLDDFVTSLRDPEFTRNLLSHGVYAYVLEPSPVRVSLWQGHITKTKEEFMKEIASPSKAYVAKVLGANRGGFFVEVRGVEAFMPGSLAAPNKIIDFESYVGKEVIVMIEDYLTEIGSFIVSHKKYIEHVLPKKISELDLEKEYTGIVTGTSKYGVFLEFNEIFTGLLHNSKMKEETLTRFDAHGFTPGDEMKFFIGEITKDNRIILTEESPQEKIDKFNRFITKNKDKEMESTVAAVMNFGVIVNVDELPGLVPMKEFKRKKIATNGLSTGDSLRVKLLEFKGEKLVFSLA